MLAEAVAKDPMTKKVHDSYMAYKAKFDAWSEFSETPTTPRSAAEPMTTRSRHRARAHRALIDAAGRPPPGSRSRSSSLMAVNVLLRYLFSSARCGRRSWSGTCWRR